MNTNQIHHTPNSTRAEREASARSTLANQVDDAARRLADARTNHNLRVSLARNTWYACAVMREAVLRYQPHPDNAELLEKIQRLADEAHEYMDQPLVINVTVSPEQWASLVPGHAEQA